MQECLPGEPVPSRLWPHGTSERTHRIPGGEHYWFFFERGAECRWQRALARGDFEQILVEPRGVHQEFLTLKRRGLLSKMSTLVKSMACVIWVWRCTRRSAVVNVNAMSYPLS